jgi:hypothetical protein
MAWNFCKKSFCSLQCSGSMTFWCGPDPSFFHHWPSRYQQKTNFFQKFFCIVLFEGTFTSFFKDKKSKEVKKLYKSRFFYNFCLKIEGSGAGGGSGSIPLTSGSGSLWPKNMWIRIRNIAQSAYIRRTCNTLNELNLTFLEFLVLKKYSIMCVFLTPRDVVTYSTKRNIASLTFFVR